MIISHGRKYIFVHIPKTGGTSLALALEDKVMKDDVLIGDTPKARNRRKRVKDVQTSGRLWKHSRLADIYGLVDQAQLEEYFIFTLVRNPWDRMVSYYHWLREQTFTHPAVKTAQQLGFSGFLNDPAIQATLGNDTTAQYVTDKTGVIRCNLFLRLEDLAADMQVLSRKLDLKLPPVTHINKSSREAGYLASYNAADQALIGEIYRDDIDRFGYQFD